MAKLVPITFESNGITYTGTLETIAGTTSTAVYHLYIANFYCGRLRNVGRWVFDATPKHLEFEGMAEVFGKVVDDSMLLPRTTKA